MSGTLVVIIKFILMFKVECIEMLYKNGLKKKRDILEVKSGFK